ncbi:MULTISPECIES: hypothetical protein [unclassified Microbacterium]|uniref:hypothetical protein n=1 Tax=unclassified Microbacterium TaxID=2609290 RepID=UPI0021A655EC|nr:MULTISPECIES: hypothetical protein [unclassified Microbacterium]MCT1365297.1 hypothetical protein [Microbacterium sp. p3-SID131]MCT1376574.1 hypothetical protein [Microbacterium sp. p3-SID337]
MPVFSQAESFAKRPAMYIGRPIRIDRVMTFLHGYEFAIRAVRQARFPDIVKVHQPAGPISQFQRQLREEGRLRWNSLELTVVAEAISWTDEQLPVLDDLSEEQHHAAIWQILPLLEQIFSFPDDVAGRRHDE